MDDVGSGYKVAGVFSGGVQGNWQLWMEVPAPPPCSYVISYNFTNCVSFSETRLIVILSHTL
jgi:hypothetical protein